MGTPAAANLRAALFEQGWVDYAVVSVGSHPTHDPAGVFDHDGKRETIAEGQKSGAYQGSVVIVRRGTLSFPVDVELTLENGSTQRLHGNAHLRRPNLLWIMLDPTRARVNLFELPLREAADCAVSIVKNRPGTRRPLI